MAPITRLSSASRTSRFEIHSDETETPQDKNLGGSDFDFVSNDTKIAFRDVTNANANGYAYAYACAALEQRNTYALADTIEKQQQQPRPRSQESQCESMKATTIAKFPSPKPTPTPKPLSQHPLEHDTVSSCWNAWNAGEMELLEELGGGAQSRVIRGRHTPTGVIYAVKMIDYHCNRKYADRELQIHKELDHPGVVEFHGHYIHRTTNCEHLCLVLEHCPHTMLDILKGQEDGRLSEPDAAKYLADILDALEYLHDHQIIHRDIKLANILVAHDGTAKIADFGISTTVKDPSKRKTIIGTEGYMAPEIKHNTTPSEAGRRYLQNIEVLTDKSTVSSSAAASAGIQISIDEDLYESQYTSNVDLYSLGATLYAMLTGQLPENANNDTESSSGFGFCFETDPDDVFDFVFVEEIVSTEAFDLLLGLLEEDPVHRLSIADVKKHPWFQRTNSERWLR